MSAEDAKKLLNDLNKLQEVAGEYYKSIEKHQEPYYTYDRSIVGGVAYVGDKLDNGNISIYFGITNKTKNVIDVSRVGYFGVGRKGNIIRFEFGGVTYNAETEGSPLVDPDKEIQVGCITSFLDYNQAKDLKEVYIKIQSKRIYFVPEKFHKQYLKSESLFLRKAKDSIRNIFQNIFRSYWQFCQNYLQKDLTNFVKDYIKFIAAFSEVVKEVHDKKATVKDEDAVSIMSKCNYGITEAFRYVKPYLNSHNKVIKNIARNLDRYINDMNNYWEGNIKASQKNDTILSADLSGKAMGAQTSLINYMQTATGEILNLMSSNPNEKGINFMISKLNDNQLEQILSEVDNYFGAELRKIDIKNKQPDEIQMSKFTWPIYYIKTFAENAILENSNDKQP